jgi:hypothetical protein
MDNRVVDLFLMTTSSKIWTGFGDSRNRDRVKATWLIADTINTLSRWVRLIGGQDRGVISIDGTAP